MKIFAHRGASDGAPENTLPAIKKAIAEQADAIEIDVQLTADGKVVVFHDEWLNRTTNGKGFICDTSFTQLRRLDAGAWFNKRFKGTRVPLLEEVLAVIKDTNVELNIELKNNLIPYPQLEEKVIKQVKKYQLDQRVIISSFRRDSLETCKRLAPHIRRGFLCWSNLSALLSQHEWRYLELYSVHPHLSLVDDQIKQLQRQNVKIYPYVVKRKADLEYCLFYGVDGFFTGAPQQARKFIKKRTAGA